MKKLYFFLSSLIIVISLDLILVSMKDYMGWVQALATIPIFIGTLINFFIAYKSKKILNKIIIISLSIFILVSWWYVMYYKVEVLNFDAYIFTIFN